MQLRHIGGALAALATIVLGFSWLQVRSGRWHHVDASVASERASLNVFLLALLLVAALLAWFLTRRPYLPVALASSGALVLSALLTSSWLRVSLHVAFAAFSTVLLWPVKLALFIGVLVTAAVIWSRLVLGRHNVADVISGLLLGTATGTVYQWWAA